MAAVNGQTGKVSVRAEKASHYYFLPWWFKAILATLLVSAGAFGAFCLGGMEVTGALLIAGMLALVLFIVTLCLFSDTVHNKFRVESGRKVFTSSGGPLRRKNGTLVQDRREIEKPVTPPVFFETLEGERRPVALDFAVFRRRLRIPEGLSPRSLYFRRLPPLSLYPHRRIRQRPLRVRIPWLRTRTRCGRFAAASTPPPSFWGRTRFRAT